MKLVRSGTIEYIETYNYGNKREGLDSLEHVWIKYQRKYFPLFKDVGEKEPPVSRTCC